MTKQQAIEAFRDLCRRYGIMWTVDVPRSAWDVLHACNKVLTEADRRAALGLRT